MRTVCVSGAASGIARALAEQLRADGQRVISVDLHDADVVADLSTPDGRTAAVEGVLDACAGRLDGLAALAGVGPQVGAVAQATVNYFGAVATLMGLKPLLAGSSAPRAVATVSMASLFPPDDALLAALTAGDEAAALARGAELEAAGGDAGNLIYGTTKRALAQLIRRTAPTPEWAGEGIPLNAIAPGVVETPMTADFTGSDEARRAVLSMVPMPLNGIFQPRDVAYLLAWLTSEENAHLCGQVVFIDGGSDAVIRGDSTW